MAIQCLTRRHSSCRESAPQETERRIGRQKPASALGAFSKLQGGFLVKQTVPVLSLVLLFASAGLAAQTPSFSTSLVDPESSLDGSAGQVSSPKGDASSSHTLTRFALGFGVSPLGLQLAATTNVSKNLNLRATGNFFNYSTNFNSSGISATGKLSLASMGVAVDYYPLHLPIRISPGLLLYNGNQLTATANVPGGDSFTLNGQNYYSATSNPLNGTGTLALNTNKAAFTITTGWGNQIPRKGHLSFPFEIGIAVVGAPTVNVNLGGTVCLDQAQTECANLQGNNPIANNFQTNLTAQVAKWNSDLKPLTTYPIISGGVAYSFHIR